MKKITLVFLIVFLLVFGWRHTVSAQTAYLDLLAKIQEVVSQIGGFGQTAAINLKLKGLSAQGDPSSPEPPGGPETLECGSQPLPGGNANDTVRCGVNISGLPAWISSSLLKNTGQNIGIGVINPGKKFDVDGGIRGSELCIGSDCRTSWPAGAGGGTVTEISEGSGLKLRPNPITGVGSASLQSCPANQILKSDAQGNWNCAADETGSATSTISGSGTPNYLARWINGTTLGNSVIQDNGVNVGIGMLPSSSPTKPRKLSVQDTVDTAIFGQGPNHGVMGYSGFSGNGVTGLSEGGVGVMGYSSDGIAVEARTIDEGGSSIYGFYQEGTNISKNYFQSPLGLGVTNPATTTMLDVAGKVKISDGTEGAGKVLTSNNTGLASWQTPMSGAGQWATSSNSIYNTNSGNVGIGFDLPKEKLHISNANSFGANILQEGYTWTPLYLFSAANGSQSSPLPLTANQGIAVLYFRGYTGSDFRIGASVAVVTDGPISSTSMPGKIIFATTPNANLIPLERMAITNSGNVGIGTTNPTAKLEVGATSGHLFFTDLDNGKKWGITTVDNADLSIRENDFSDANARLTVKAGGNVGIGISIPAEKLDLGGGNIKMGYQVVTSQAQSTNTVSASCPAGKYALSGGCFTASPVNLRTSSIPNPAFPASWQCIWNTAASSITAQAICANIR